MNQPRVKVRLIMLLALVVAGAFFFMYQTPEYALYRWRQSVERRDLATFYSYLDLPKVINSIKDAENTRRIRQETGSDWQAVARAIETQMSKVLSSVQLHLVQRDIEGKFRKADLPAPPDAVFGDLLATRNFLLDATAFELGSVARRGKEALANLEVVLPKMNKTYSLLLVLEKDGQWRISRLEGLASTLDEYAQDQQNYVQVYNEQVRTRLREALPCTTSMNHETKLMGLSHTLRLHVRCKNLLPDTITGFTGHVIPESPQGQTLKKIPVRMSSITWKSGEEFSMNQDEKIGLIEKADAFTGPDVRVAFVTQEVTFSSGTALRPVSAYENIP